MHGRNEPSTAGRGIICRLSGRQQSYLLFKPQAKANPNCSNQNYIPRPHIERGRDVDLVPIRATESFDRLTSDGILDG